MRSYIIFFILLGVLNSCSPPEYKAIKMAGKNKKELQKVLDHFKKDSSVRLQEAAKFLIKNMPKNFSADTSTLSSVRPFLPEACSLYVNEEHSLIDLKWEEYKNKQKIAPQYFDYHPDYKIIQGDFLIEDIKLAYATWIKNPFNKNASFNDFCEYVLPYKRKNGLPIESWRKHFLEKPPEHFYNFKDIPLIVACDSLLFHYKDLKHNKSQLSDLPLLKIEDFETLKRGNCETKCWYNSMLFAAHGIPCAIDFVPAWGNRNASHSWNVIIKNGKSHAFEPFWEQDRWKYKRIYNNESFDDRWGEFRLPKVYRHTYSSHKIEPIVDSRVKLRNIPPLFRNIKKKDVSDEYFKTYDLEITLDENMPDDTYYCYLCVFGYNDWHPVQWGKIEGAKVQFKGMGKDIVYLPCYYKSGELIHATDPFLLNSQGDLVQLEANSTRSQNIVLNRVNFQSPKNATGINILGGSRIEFSEKSDFEKPSQIYTLPDTMLCQMNLHRLNKAIKGRFIRIIFQGEIAELSELSFFQKTADDTLARLNGEIICSEDIEKSKAKKAFDQLIATDFTTHLHKDENLSEEKQLWVGLDLGKLTTIDAIGYSPRVGSNLYKKDPFELFFWKDGWRSLAIKQGTGNNMIFNNVPDNALMMLKNKNWGQRGAERIFIYKNGEQKWY
ncbi:MAG: hypothetical protein ACQESP_12455 [Candidatus Muiribacteriota bacterium]